MPQRPKSGAAYFSKRFDRTTACEDLVSHNEQRQLSALEHVIAYMITGSDMSSLFNEVAALCNARNVTLRRLSYLYLLENSHAQPERAVLQAGTLVKHTLSECTLTRGAALRTLTNLQLPSMSDFCTAPLVRCLEDSDAYVRSIAVFGVLKQYCTSPLVCSETGLLDSLKPLLTDESPLVVGACAQVIVELHQRSAPSELMSALVAARPHLISLLSGAGEWTLHYLLEGIAATLHYDCGIGDTEATDVRTRVEGASPYPLERDVLAPVLPYLNIMSTPVATSAANVVVSVLMRFAGPSAHLPVAERQRLLQRYGSRVADSFTAQLHAPRHELRYVALRSITLLMSTMFASLFEKHVGSFIIKYDDPIYIKTGKLEVLVKLANERNGARILNELVTYASETDSELVKKSIRGLGTVALTIPPLAAFCMSYLDELINTGVTQVVENAMVVVQMILRQYPSRFLDVCSVMCASMDIVRDPEARAALAWTLGEHPDSIPDVHRYLSVFSESFTEEPRTVQLAFLTAVVKIYVKEASDSNAGEHSDMVERILSMGCASYDPDIRSRSYYYWRLLALDLSAARQITCSADLPVSTISEFEQSGYYKLIGDLGCLSAVLPFSPGLMLASGEATSGVTAPSSEDEWEMSTLPSDFALLTVISHKEAARIHHDVSVRGSLTECISLAPSNAAKSAPLYQVVLPAEMGNGLEVGVAWSQFGTQLVLRCRFKLHSGDDYVHSVCVTALQMNWNMFGLGIAQVFPTTTLDKDRGLGEMGLIVAPNNKMRPTHEIELAVEFKPVGVRHFVAPSIPPVMLLLPAAAINPRDFHRAFKAFLTPTWSMPPQILPVISNFNRIAANSLRVHCFHLVHRKDIQQSKSIGSGAAAGEDSVSSPVHLGSTVTGIFLSAETISRQRLFVEVTLQDYMVILLTVRCDDAPIAPFFGEYLMHVLAVSEGM